MHGNPHVSMHQKERVWPCLKLVLVNSFKCDLVSFMDKSKIHITRSNFRPGLDLLCILIFIFKRISKQGNHDTFITLFLKPLNLFRESRQTNQQHRIKTTNTTFSFISSSTSWIYSFASTQTKNVIIDIQPPWKSSKTAWHRDRLSILTVWFLVTGTGSGTAELLGLAATGIRYEEGSVVCD